MVMKFTQNERVRFLHLWHQCRLVYGTCVESSSDTGLAVASRYRFNQQINKTCGKIMKNAGELYKSLSRLSVPVSGSPIHSDAWHWSVNVTVSHCHWSHNVYI